MKKTIIPLAIAVALSLFTNICFAQGEQKPGAPKWISDKGYWVVESNIHTPKSNTLYFYNNDDVLVYKEQVEGMKIKLNKKKVMLRLKSVLDQSITAWEAQHIAKENTMLVSIALRK